MAVTGKYGVGAYGVGAYSDGTSHEVSCSLSGSGAFSATANTVLTVSSVTLNGSSSISVTALKIANSYEAAAGFVAYGSMASQVGVKRSRVLTMTGAMTATFEARKIWNKVLADSDTFTDVTPDTDTWTAVTPDTDTWAGVAS